MFFSSDDKYVHALLITRYLYPFLLLREQNREMSTKCLEIWSRILLEMAKPNWSMLVCWQERIPGVMRIMILFFVDDRIPSNRYSWDNRVCFFEIMGQRPNTFVVGASEQMMGIKKTGLYPTQQLLSLVEKSSRPYINTEKINKVKMCNCSTIYKVFDNQQKPVIVLTNICNRESRFQQGTLSNKTVSTSEYRTSNFFEKPIDEHIVCDTKIDTSIVKRNLKRIAMEEDIFTTVYNNRKRGTSLSQVRSNTKEEVNVDEEVTHNIVESGNNTDTYQTTNSVEEETSIRMCEIEERSEDIPLHENSQGCVSRREVNKYQCSSHSEVIMDRDTDTSSNYNTVPAAINNNMNENQAEILNTVRKSKQTRNFGVKCSNKCSDNLKNYKVYVNNKMVHNQAGVEPLDIYKKPVLEQNLYSIKPGQDFPVANKDQSKHTENSSSVVGNHEIMKLQTGEKDDILNNITNSAYVQAWIQNSINVYMFSASKQPNINGIPCEAYEAYSVRIGSFARYPHSSVKSKSILASAGFVYIGEGVGDNVKCYICHVEKQNWQTDEDVFETHRRLSPDCSMARSITPITVSTNEAGEACSHTVTSPELRTTIENDHRSRNSFSVEQYMASIHSTVANAQPMYHYANNGCSIPSEENVQSPRTIASHSHETVQHLDIPIVRQEKVDEAYIPPSTSLPASLSPLGEQEASVRMPDYYYVFNRSLAQPSNTPGQTFRSEGNSSEETSIHSTVSSSQQCSTLTYPTGNASSAYTTSSSASTASAMNPPTSCQVVAQVTYRDLGIVVAKPRFPQFASLSKRLGTFASFPRHHPINPEDISKAGMIYTGKEDCCRCFFCGGSLRHWEVDDNPYVEHARWFCKCPYICQYMGQDFVDSVQALNNSGGTITLRSVEEHMVNRGTASRTALAIKNDAAVRSIVDDRHCEEQVLHVATELKTSGIPLSADAIMRRLHRQISKAGSDRTNADEDESNINDEELQQLIARNVNIRKNMTCKICMDKELEMVFLPCGHLVSCLECAIVLQICPVCRTSINGMVRAYLP